MSILEIAGAVFALLSASGTAILMWSVLSRGRPSEELLLFTAVAALIGWYGTRTLLPQTIVLWGFAVLFSLTVVSAVYHAVNMWPSYIAVTVTTLVICLAGFLLLFGLVG